MVHLQRHQDDDSNQDSEERATQDALVLAGSSVGATRAGAGARAAAAVAVLAEATTAARRARTRARGRARATRATAGIVARGATLAEMLASTAARGGGNAVTSGSGSRSRRTAGASTQRGVRASSTQGAQDSRVADEGDVALQGISAGVGVRVGAGLLRAGGDAVALDADIADGRKVITVLLDIRAVPVDGTTGPSDRAGGAAGRTGRPDGKLQARGGLRVLVNVGGRVVGGRLGQCALHGAVDAPGQLVGAPVELVGVPVIEGVAAGDGQVLAVVPYTKSQHERKMVRTRGARAYS